MGFWNDGIRSGSPSRDRSRSGSRTRTSSKHESSSNRHYSSRPSNARSTSSFFSNISGAGGGSSGTPRGRSYSTRAKPRSGFVARLRKFLRDLYSYMRRHPVKVFFLVIMPLITGGALTKILAQFGVRLPKGLESMVGKSMNRGYGESERYYARGGARDVRGGAGVLDSMGGIAGVGSSVQTALGIAKMFM